MTGPPGPGQGMGGGQPPHAQGGSGGDRSPRGSRVLEHPEVHGGHRLAGRGPRAPGGHEPALAERGALGAGDVHQAGGDGQLLAELDGPEVDLIAVGRDHRPVPGLVEQGRHRAERVVAAARPVQSRHRPDLDHRGRRRVLAPLVGRGAADRFQPVPDHRQVDRVAGKPRRAVAGGDDPVRGGADRLGGSDPPQTLPAHGGAARPPVSPGPGVIAVPGAGQGRRSRSARAAPRSRRRRTSARCSA